MQWFQNLGLSAKLMVPIMLIGLVVFGVSAAVMVSIKQQNTQAAGENTARALANQIVSLRSFYTTEIVSRAKKMGIKLNYDFADHDDVLPLPATLVHTLGERIAEDYPGTVVRLYSRHPFPHRAASETYDDFEQHALSTLEQRPDTPVTMMGMVNGQFSVRYAVADRMRKACVGCHNSHPESPKTDWKEGDVRGIVEVVVPVEAVDARMTAGMMTVGGTFIVGIMATLGLIVMIVRKAIVHPMTGLYRAAEGVSEGDLAIDMSVSSGDEVGQLAGVFNRMAAGLRHKLATVTESVVPLRTASEDLSSVGEQMAHNVTRMNELSTTTAGAAQEMSGNMDTVVAVSEEATSNVTIIATATEEMSATIEEIAKNAETARQVTAQAVQSVTGASSRVDELRDVTHDISQVTDVILEIAEQTKLLALNATIEAARAGEAGSGFAVVANEVKELAQQTNEATEDIRVKIESMQRSTAGTVHEITQIHQVIGQVNDLVSNIAAAVEEQAVTTRDIASNVHRTAAGIEEMSDTVSQAAGVSREIRAQAETVHQVSSEMDQFNTQLSTQAAELSRMSDGLRAMVASFSVGTEDVDVLDGTGVTEAGLDPGRGHFPR